MSHGCRTDRKHHCGCGPASKIQHSVRCWIVARGKPVRWGSYESGRRKPAFGTLERLIAATGHRLEIRLEPAPDARPGLPDTPLGRRLRQRRRQVLAAAEKHGASNVKVFGSVARGQDTLESDIDILVDLSPRSSLVTLGRLERELSDVLGVPVDVWRFETSSACRG